MTKDPGGKAAHGFRASAGDWSLLARKAYGYLGLCLSLVIKGTISVAAMNGGLVVWTSASNV
jgi:hypothetical protein